MLFLFLFLFLRIIHQIHHLPPDRKRLLRTPLPQSGPAPGLAAAPAYAGRIRDSSFFRIGLRRQSCVSSAYVFFPSWETPPSADRVAMPAEGRVIGVELRKLDRGNMAGHSVDQQPPRCHCQRAAESSGRRSFTRNNRPPETTALSPTAGRSLCAAHPARTV